jgi:diguanylate cyclase (GGDEF)-like protein
VTLFRQLIIAIVAIFVILYSVDVGIGIYQSRQLVEQQMKVHAQDTATSLALSVSQLASENDIATLETLFNAVSDSGYYQRIYFENLEKEIIVDRTFPVQVEGVPQWYVRLIGISPHEGKAEVSSGWTRLGELTVVSHTGQFYLRLWEQNKEQLWWFSLVTLGVCVLSAIALSLILRPLKSVERQANAICDKEFIVQESLPKTRELRLVVQAMNRMAKQLKGIFDSQLNLIHQLQQKALRDSVTGLSNRADFDARFDSLTTSVVGPVSGAVYIIALAHFELVNDKAGREEGNTILRRIGEVLEQVTDEYSDALLARRQGPQFSIFVPNLIKEDALEFAQKVFDAALTVEWKFQDKDALVIHLGMSFSPEIENPRDMLIEADLALKKSQSNGNVSSWAELGNAEGDTNVPLLSRPIPEWRTLLEAELESKTLPLVFQSIFSADKQVIGQEVFARLESDGRLITAGIFMPLVERFGLSVEFDQLVLDRVASFEANISKDQFICINLCITSIQNEEFVLWLDKWLANHSTLATRLVMEIPEHAMRVIEPIQALVQVLQRYGVRLGIDHFGLDSTAFGYLASLPLHHAKVHHSFIQEIDSKPDNRFYIESLAQITRSRDILLMVEGIENQEEWDTVVTLGIDAGQGVDAAQGFWLSAPATELP